MPHFTHSTISHNRISSFLSNYNRPMCFGKQFWPWISKSPASSFLNKTEVISSLKSNSKKLLNQVLQSEAQKNRLQLLLSDALKTGDAHHITLHRDELLQHNRDILFYSRLQQQFEFAAKRVQRAQTDAQVIHEFMEATRDMLDRNGKSFIDNFDDNATEQREVLNMMMEFVTDIIDEATFVFPDNRDSHVQDEHQPKQQYRLSKSLRNLSTHRAFSRRVKPERATF